MEDTGEMMSTRLRKKEEEIDESWEPVKNDRRKKKIIPKLETESQIQNEDEDVDLTELPKKSETTFNLSELIRENVCIHCLGIGKCREGTKDHSGIYFPDEIREYISNPRKMESLDSFLRKNVPKNPIFQPFQISYSICLFNHCRKHCKHCRAGRSGFVKDEDGTELWYCYPELTRVQRNRNLILGLHIDLNLKIGSSHSGEWKPIHYPILTEQEEEEIAKKESEFISTKIVKNIPSPISTEWLEIAKKPSTIPISSKSVSQVLDTSDKTD